MRPTCWTEIASSSERMQKAAWQRATRSWQLLGEATEKARPQEPHPPASSQQPARRPQHPQQQQPPERRPQEQRKPQQQAQQQAPQRPQPAQQKQRPTQPSQPPAKPQPQQPPAQHERQEKPKAAEPEVVATAAHPPTTENGSVLPPGTPKTGVQVLSMEERNGVVYFTVRDLRNNSIIRNVTMKSARDLWHYAITQFADHPSGPEDIEWQGDRAVLAREMRAGKMRSDLAMRDANGKVVVFYGVTDDGLDERWRELIAAFGARNGMAAQSPAPPADGAPPASPEQTEAQASQATEEEMAA